MEMSSIIFPFGLSNVCSIDVDVVANCIIAKSMIIGTAPMMSARVILGSIGFSITRSTRMGSVICCCRCRRRDRFIGKRECFCFFSSSSSSSIAKETCFVVPLTMLVTFVVACSCWVVCLLVPMEEGLHLFDLRGILGCFHSVERHFHYCTSIPLVGSVDPTETTILLLYQYCGSLQWCMELLPVLVTSRTGYCSSDVCSRKSAKTTSTRTDTNITNPSERLVLACRWTYSSNSRFQPNAMVRETMPAMIFNSIEFIQAF